MKHIFVALDFDESVPRLLEMATTLAKPFEAKVWLVHIAAPDPDFIGYDVGPQYIRDTRAEELRAEHRSLEQYAGQLREAGIAAEGLLVMGATIEMIMEEAEKLKADLIIAGHEERGFFYQAFTGSVSQQIVRQSKVPVLIVPTGA